MTLPGAGESAMVAGTVASGSCAGPSYPLLRRDCDTECAARGFAISVRHSCREVRVPNRRWRAAEVPIRVERDAGGKAAGDAPAIRLSPAGGRKGRTVRLSLLVLAEGPRSRSAKTPLLAGVDGDRSGRRFRGICLTGRSDGRCACRLHSRSSVETIRVHRACRSRPGDRSIRGSGNSGGELLGSARGQGGARRE